MEWKKENFYKFVVENNLLGFFKEPIKLSSGRLSYWYVNWRTVAESVFLLDILSDYVIAFVRSLSLKPDCYYGVPEGATKLGIITQFKWAKNQPDYHQNKYVLSMGRSQPKNHGDPKDKYFLGIPQGKVVVLEDVTTTGGSLVGAIEKLKELKAEIIAAIGLTNRNEKRDDGKTVEEIIKENGVKYYAMSEAIELLPLIYNKAKPGKSVGKQVEDYFKIYGIKELKLL